MRLPLANGQYRSATGRTSWLTVLPFFMGAGLLFAAQAANAQPPSSEVPLRVDDYSTKYDDLFRHYSLRYFGPFVDWRWFKSQAIAESLLNPRAQSIAGARGVMQLLPRTFEEVRVNNPSWNNIHSPRWNIAAGVFYSYTLYQQWNSVLHGNDRLLFTLASYNAGVQRVRYAYTVSHHAHTYHDIRPRLPPETRLYVDRIRSLMEPKAIELTPVVAELNSNEALTSDSLR